MQQLLKYPAFNANIRKIKHNYGKYYYKFGEGFACVRFYDGCEVYREECVLTPIGWLIRRLILNDDLTARFTCWKPTTRQDVQDLYRYTNFDKNYLETIFVNLFGERDENDYYDVYYNYEEASHVRNLY